MVCVLRIILCGVFFEFPKRSTNRQFRSFHYNLSRLNLLDVKLVQPLGCWTNLALMCVGSIGDMTTEFDFTVALFVSMKVAATGQDTVKHSLTKISQKRTHSMKKAS